MPVLILKTTFLLFLYAQPLGLHVGVARHLLTYTFQKDSQIGAFDATQWSFSGRLQFELRPCFGIGCPGFIIPLLRVFYIRQAVVKDRPLALQP